MTKTPSEFAKEFMKEADKKGGSKKVMMSDIVGMPDDQDRDFIRKELTFFDRQNPGMIRYTRDQARAEHAKTATHTRFTKGGEAARRLKEYGEVNTASQGRLMLEMPAELYRRIEAAYPTMFVDRKHFAWFKKNFPELFVPEKL